MSDVLIAGAAVAYANHGRWVADCPNRWCTSAMQLVRGQAQFVCTGEGTCGTEADIQWPADPVAIELILVMRPASVNRNWAPGESLEDLLRENAEHGIVPPGMDAEQPTVIAAIADDRLVGGVLHQQLTAAMTRQQIGD